MNCSKNMAVKVICAPAGTHAHAHIYIYIYAVTHTTHIAF